MEAILGKINSLFVPRSLEVKYKRDSQEAVNTAITGKWEEKLKEILCPKIPLWLNPDHFTLLGVIGMVMASSGFIFGFINKYYLILAVIGLFLHWFGDTFDGGIARYRKKTRPNYGYYIDKMVDTITTIILGLGIGLSGFVKIEIALVWTCMLLALISNVSLIIHVENKCKNSFGWFGPTEIRILGIVIAIVMFFSPIKIYDIFGYTMTQYDLVFSSVSIIMFVILIVNIISKGIELNKKDTKNWRI
ncbi:MAG: CDP-alcohol phosphatidyltransferase family protein [Candidatus Dojkabacteria bacterium]